MSPRRPTGSGRARSIPRSRLPCCSLSSRTSGARLGGPSFAAAGSSRRPLGALDGRVEANEVGWPVKRTPHRGFLAGQEARFGFVLHLALFNSEHLGLALLSGCQISTTSEEDAGASCSAAEVDSGVAFRWSEFKKYPADEQKARGS